MSNGDLGKSSRGTSSDPRVVMLRRRLGSVPEIVQKFGPPPGEQGSAPPQGRGRTLSLSGLPPHLEDGPEAKEREKKRTELKTTLRSYEKMIPVYERQLGTSAEAKFRDRLPDYKKRAMQVDVIRDHKEACDVMGPLCIELADGQREMNQLVAQDRDKQNLLTTLNTVSVANVAPNYEGKAVFKSTGKKEFERDVVKPVADFLKKIDASVRAGNPISEEQQGELAQLRSMLERKSSDYDDKADTVDEKKNKHTHKLYKDYEAKCDELRDKLATIEQQSVPKALLDYREKKREAAALLERLQKRVDLWRKIDAESHEQYANLAAQKKTTFDNIVDNANQGGNVLQARDLLVELIADMKRTIDGVFGSKESNDKLDEHVKAIGAKPTKKADIEFLKEAFMARYNLNSFSGDLTPTSLAAFYKVFALVPDSHTKLNKWLTDLERHQSLEDVSSFYSGKDKATAPEPKGLVAIKAMRSSGPLAMVQNGLMGPALLKNVVGNKKVDQFSWVTLHEIGHAVDHSEDFMKKNNATYGNWTKHTAAEVEQMMVDHLQAEFPAYPKEFISKYIGHIIKGEKPQEQEALTTLWTKGSSTLRALGKDANERKQTLLNVAAIRSVEQARIGFEANGWPGNDVIQQSLLTALNATPAAPKDYSALVDAICFDVLTNKKTAAKAVDDQLDKLGGETSAKPNWEALKKSDTLVWYKAAVLVEPAGVLEGIKQMTGAANWVRAGELPRNDGRIWQEAYKGQWLSYDAAIRTDRVTDYQMRAEGEYFAESYAAYFLGKLPGTARLYADLQLLEQKTLLDS